MTTTTPTTPALSGADAEGRSTGAERFEAPTDLRLRPQRRKIQLPWVLLGLLLVVGSGLTFAIWADGAHDRTEVLALARSVDAGQTIDTRDLTTAAVGSSTPVNVIGSDRLADVVGRTALVRLEVGTLLSDDLLAEGALVDEGRALVAVSLPAETIPAHEFRAGDAVMVVEAPGVDAPLDGDQPVAPQVWAAEVFSVASIESLDGTNLAVVTLEVDPFSAAEIAAAAAADRVRLVTVATVDGIPRDLVFGASAGGIDLDGGLTESASGAREPGEPLQTSLSGSSR